MTILTVNNEETAMAASGAGRKPGAIRCEYLAEPLLIFGNGGLHVDPRSGIARYGPRSYAPAKRHPDKVRVGLIGTADTMETTKQWLTTNAEGVQGDAKHPEFPGFRHDRGFFSALEFDDGWNAQLTQTELKDRLKIRTSRDRFEQIVQLLDSKLRMLAERDSPPQYVLIGLPREIVGRCRVTDYFDSALGNVHRDLRRAIKALAMQYRIPTQLLRQPTMEGKDDDHPSKIAWNFFNGLYFKAGGVPWGPYGLEPGTCFIGISFYRPLGSKFPTMQTSLMQAFDEHGEGLVLRGHSFDWDPDATGSRSPHLTEQQAADLIDLALTRYQQEMKQAPSRVVIHKSSRFWPAERQGIEAVLRHRVSRYDLLALAPQSEVRLLTASKYPALRGTQFSVGDLDYLYTTGFLAPLNEYHAMHVPSPLQIADHVGQDTTRQQLLREVLALTKINPNSARLGGLLPITIKFSKLVGEIMREIPDDAEPLPQYKFYM